jgi:hypothetical protein
MKKKFIFNVVVPFEVSFEDFEVTKEGAFEIIKNEFFERDGDLFYVDGLGFRIESKRPILMD